MSRATVHLTHAVPFAVLLAATLVASGGGRNHSAQTQPDCPAFAPPIRVAPSAPCGFRCGKERWPVKTLTDRDVDKVDFTPRLATVTQLGKFPVPKKRPRNHRAGSAELHVYCVDAWAIDFAGPQSDGDLHVLIAGIEDANSRMIVEFPDVGCATVCASRYAPAISAARTAMERKLATFKTDRIRVRLVGVGFFDRNHGQLGAAPNFFELHPVLAVSFP